MKEAIEPTHPVSKLQSRKKKTLEGPEETTREHLYVEKKVGKKEGAGCE
jgi:hypothetical protein